MKTINFPLLIFIFTSMFYSCKKDESLESAQNPLNIRFNLLCNGENLSPNVQYLNNSSELFSISAFKMYIGGISLNNTNTQNQLPQNNITCSTIWILPLCW